MKKVTKNNVGGDTVVKKMISPIRFFSAFISPAIQCPVPVSDGFVFIYLIQPCIYFRYEYTSMYKFIIIISK